MTQKNDQPAPGQGGLSKRELEALGATEDRKAKEVEVKGGRKERPPHFLKSGQVTGTGQNAERFVSSAVTQVAVGFADEAIGQKEVRNDGHRSAALAPSYGRVPMPEERFPRTLTEFWFVPIRWVDEKFAWKIVKHHGKKRLVRCKILRARRIKSLRRGRRWTLWSKGGPYFPLLYHEGRIEVRRSYRYFRPRHDYDYKLIRDPWRSGAKERYWATNPELAGLSLEEIESLIASGEVPDEFSEWEMLNETAQWTWFNKIELLILLRCLEDPRNCDPHKVVVDYHWNQRHDCLVNPVRTMELDPSGSPVYDSDGGYYAPRLLEYPPNIGRLINSLADAEELYELTHGYDRVDFDPRCNVYRDLWGNYYDQRDPWHGIISDVERIAETMLPAFREIQPRGPEKEESWIKRAFSMLIPKWLDPVFEYIKGEPLSKPDQPYRQWWRIGPSHSVADIDGELSQEALVQQGKSESSKKLWSHEDRVINTGDVTMSLLEKDTSAWLGGSESAIQTRILNDGHSFVPYIEFWSGLIDPKHSPLGKLWWCRVPAEEFYRLVEGAPPPTDFRARTALWEYFKFDPEACKWGYDEHGRPRAPKDLIERLILDPTLGGLNMTAHNGKRVLENYRDKIGDARVQAFWHMSDTTFNRELARGKGDFMTMAYAFWRPMETLGDYRVGLLTELTLSQPSQPYAQRVDSKVGAGELNRLVDTLSIYREESDGHLDIGSGRPDMELIHQFQRRRCVYWMYRRMAEMHFIGHARAYNQFGKWYEMGWPARIGNDTESHSLRKNAGRQQLMERTFDALQARGESQDDFLWEPDEENRFKRSTMASRAVPYPFHRGEEVPEDGNTVAVWRREISDWLTTWAGFAKYSKKDFEGVEGALEKIGEARIKNGSWVALEELLGRISETRDTEDALRLLTIQTAEAIRIGAPWEHVMNILLNLEKTEEQIEAVRVCYATYHGYPAD